MTRNDPRTTRTWLARAALTATLIAGAFTAFTAAPTAQADEPLLTATQPSLVTLTYTADASLAGSPATIVDAAGTPVAMTVIVSGLNVVTVPDTGALAYFVLTPGGGVVCEANESEDWDTGSH